LVPGVARAFGGRRRRGERQLGLAEIAGALGEAPALDPRPGVLRSEFGDPTVSLQRRRRVGPPGDVRRLSPSAQGL